MDEKTSQTSSFIAENHAELKRQLAEANNERQKLAEEIAKLKQTHREYIVSNTLEKAFYQCGGKSGRDEDGYSYYDMLRDRAMKYVQVNDSGLITFVDPLDNLPLRKNGRPFAPEDLMLKLRSSGTSAALFDTASSSATVDPRSFGADTTREQLRQIRDPAARLARARELGIK